MDNEKYFWTIDNGVLTCVYNEPRNRAFYSLGDCFVKEYLITEQKPLALAFDPNFVRVGAGYDPWWAHRIFILREDLTTACLDVHYWMAESRYHLVTGEEADEFFWGPQQLLRNPRKLLEYVYSHEDNAVRGYVPRLLMAIGSGAQ